MSGLLRSNVVVASGTALSRITGLLRLIILGYVLGQTALSDAYLIANELLKAKIQQLRTARPLVRRSSMRSAATSLPASERSIASTGSRGHSLHATTLIDATPLFTLPLRHSSALLPAYRSPRAPEKSGCAPCPPGSPSRWQYPRN